MDREMCLDFLEVEGISFLATHYVQTRGGWGFVCLYCCGFPCGKLGTCTGL